MLVVTRGPLVPIGPLVTCTMMSLPGGYRRGMSFCVIFGRSRRLAFALDDFHAAVEAARDDVPIMQEGVLLKADVDEGGLQAVFEVSHLAFENAAHQPFFGGALDVELFQACPLRARRRGFPGSPR